MRRPWSKALTFYVSASHELVCCSDASDCREGWSGVHGGAGKVHDGAAYRVVPENDNCRRSRSVYNQTCEEVQSKFLPPVNASAFPHVCRRTAIWFSIPTCNTSPAPLESQISVVCASLIINAAFPFRHASEATSSIFNNRHTSPSMLYTIASPRRGIAA